jgi:hypothetical protein
MVIMVVVFFTHYVLAFGRVEGLQVAFVKCILLEIDCVLVYVNPWLKLNFATRPYNILYWRQSPRRLFCQSELFTLNRSKLIPVFAPRRHQCNRPITRHLLLFKWHVRLT